MSHYRDMRVALEAIETQAIAFNQRLYGRIINDSQVFICGNGGSAAIANHFAADVNKRLGGHYVTSLCENQSLITAIANDVSYEQVFVEQLKMRPVGTLICVSSSGSSPNVVNAASYALGRGAEVYSLTGKSDKNVLQTMLYKWPQRCLHVPSMSYGIIEDCHMVVLHDLIEVCKEALQ